MTPYPLLGSLIACLWSAAEYLLEKLGFSFKIEAREKFYHRHLIDILLRHICSCPTLKAGCYHKNTPLQGLATWWLTCLPGRGSHPLDYTTLPGRTINRPLSSFFLISLFQFFCRTQKVQLFLLLPFFLLCI